MFLENSRYFKVNQAEAQAEDGRTVKVVRLRRLPAVSGSATPDIDYTALNGTVTISAGSTSATIDVVTSLDSLVEADETIIVTLDEITSGSHEFNASTQDPAGNQVTATTTPVTIIADFDAPTAEFTSPVPGSWSHFGPQELSWGPVMFERYAGRCTPWTSLMNGAGNKSANFAYKGEKNDCNARK